MRVLISPACMLLAFGSLPGPGSGVGVGPLSHRLLFVGGPVGSPHGIVFCHQGTSGCCPISEPDLPASSTAPPLPGTSHKEGALQDHGPLPSACWVLHSAAEVSGRRGQLC